MAPIITDITTHFTFHIRCISVHKILDFSFFSASFCMTFLSVGSAVSISMHVFSFLFLIIIFDLFAVPSPSVCTPWFRQHYHLVHILVCVCVCVRARVRAYIIIIIIIIIIGRYKRDAKKKRARHTKPISIQPGRIRKATKTLVQIR